MHAPDDGDGKVLFTSKNLVELGTFVKVKILDANEYDLYGVTYSDISNDVDNEFEDELNSLSFDEIGFGNELVEHLARKFGGDAAKAIHESEDTQAAVLNLAEQVKMIKVNLIRSKNR